MPVNYELKLYPNLNANAGGPLFSGAADTSSATPPGFMQADNFPVRFFATDYDPKADIPLTNVDLGADAIITFAGADDSEEEYGATLIECSEFVREVAGEIVSYVGTLNQNTELVAAALEGKKEIPLAIDLEMANADYSIRRTLRFQGVLRAQVARGGELPASSPDPYPPAAGLLLAGSFPEIDLIVDQNYIDIPIPAGTTRAASLRVRRPSDDADAIEPRSDLRLNDTTLRVNLNGAPAVPGYKLTYFLRVAPISATEDIDASSEVHQEITVGLATVDFTIPAGDRWLLENGVEMPVAATGSDDAIQIRAVQRLTATTARGYLNGAPALAGYVAHIRCPLKS